MLAAAVTGAVLVALLVPMALLIRTVAENGALSRATSAAESVVVAVGTPDLPLAVERMPVPATVFLPDGRVLGEPAPVSDAVRLAKTGRSVTAQAQGGREVLVSVRTAEGPVVIRVFVGDAELAGGVREAWLALGLLALALVVLGIVLADRLALRVTRPVGELARLSHRLAGGDLSARAEPGGPPEVESVGRALNHLAGRIGDLLEAERESVADLSHRLRTPLMGLGADAESLRDPEEAARIGARADALERAVSAVIEETRRRADRDAAEAVTPARRPSCDATSVVRGRVLFWSVLAEDQERAFTIELPDGPAEVAVSEGDLAACVDALLGNVFAHTAEGLAFAVRLAATATGAVLTVSDDGPGFPAEFGERGSSGGGSTGLGLDIARRTAQASGGGMRVAGSAVELVLGRGTGAG
ncbi:HAMP domain-containing sensor histidine kinase [Nonomuraea longicatena]|uniref:Signal transduction histidine-protein kinase/phosphatase MprB n=2 Tax=Nonomuraea longicatena TaxID=83682 RepID=A0ABN1PJ63_9ACTN